MLLFGLLCGKTVAGGMVRGGVQIFRRGFFFYFLCAATFVLDVRVAGPYGNQIDGIRRRTVTVLVERNG